MKIPITVRDVKAMAFDKNKYDQNYKKEHFERMEILLPKGTKEVFKQTANELGISVGELVRQAVAEKIDSVK